MKSKVSAPIVIVVLACTLVGSWSFVHTRAARAPAPPPASDPLPRTAASEWSGVPLWQRAPSFRADSELARRSAAITALSDVAARKAAWVEWLAELAQTQPELAAERAFQLSEQEGQSEVLREVLQVWLASASGAASAWLLARAERLPAEQVVALSALVAGFDVAPGLQLAETLPQGLRASALRAVFGEWTAQQPWAAAHAAEQLTEAADRVAAIGEVARLWVHTDPTAALAWSREVGDGQLQRVAIDALLGTWVEADPAAAAAAVLSMPATVARARWLDRTLEPWAATDPEAAQRFVQQLRDPSERESAATTLLLQLVQSQPARAAEWARGFQADVDGPLLEKFMTSWVAHDANAAVAWAQASPARAPLLTLALSRWQQQDEPAYRNWQLAQLAQAPHRSQP